MQKQRCTISLEKSVEDMTGHGNTLDQGTSTNINSVGAVNQIPQILPTSVPAKLHTGKVQNTVCDNCLLR